MTKLACLTLETVGDYVIDDDLAYTELRRRGWQVDVIPWTQPVDWSAYDRVLIRTPWDYQNAPQQFLQVLEAIEASGTPLQNPLDVVRWNLSKTYLRDLDSAGVPIVPSVWGEQFDAEQLAASFDHFGCQRVVIKPTVSANAYHTYPLRRDELQARRSALADVFANRPYLIQPFLDEVVSAGEVSLFYFGGQYSHAITKQPKAGDFRVQEEHGGMITALEPDAALQAAAQQALAAVPAPVLYARADFVRVGGADLLMELELIEPSLYFRMHADAPANFADALACWADLSASQPVQRDS